MKKQTLLKTLASIGIIFSESSCKKEDLMSDAIPTNQTCLDGDKKHKSNDTFVPFTPIAEIYLPKHIQNEIIAVGKLSHDIFTNPSIADSFSRDPESYLKSIGLENVSLDLNSVEVRTAIAMGDKEIREAIMRNDLNEYVAILEEKYIDYSNISIDADVKAFLEYTIENNPELRNLILRYKNDNTSFRAAIPIFVAAPAVFYAIYAVASQAAVAYNVAGTINATVLINLAAWVNVQTSPSSSSSTATSTISSTASHLDVDISSNSTSSVNVAPMSYFHTTYMSSMNANSYVFANISDKIHFEITDVQDNIIVNNPVLKIWGLETNSNDMYVINKLIENNVEAVTKVIQNTEILNKNKQMISEEELKTLLRKPITQKMIDLGIL